MALLPPGGLPEIVFSFDTTGSMHACLAEVRNRLQDMIQRLQADISGIRIAVFAHGDYCDKDNYVTKYVDFTNDVTVLSNFVNSVSETGGGDSDECYELVLRQVREKLSWTLASNRVLIMIGDANPHEPNYAQNKQKIDWRIETEKLAKMGVKIYAVQCRNSVSADQFYKTISEKTSGRHLRLNNIFNVFDFLMAICYRERGDDFLNVYEKEVRSRCDASLPKELAGLFTALRDDTRVDGVISPLPSSPLPARKTLKKITKPKFSKKASLTRKCPPGASTVTLKKNHTIQKTKKSNKPITPLLRRENVPENNFMLNELRWSPWIRVISPVKPPEAHWVKRKGEGRGYRKAIIFHGKKVPALYEVSVQAKIRTRRFVVFSKFMKGMPEDVNWERRLLRTSDVRRQVDQVVKDGCSVFVRRVVLSRRASAKNAITMLRKYDYAWRVSRRRPNHRTVVKCDVKISDEVY